MRINNKGYRAVIEQIREFQPDVVFTHAYTDYNDHHVVNKLTEEAWFHAALPCAISELPLSELMPLYEFEVVLEMIHEPSVIVDITDTYEAKVNAMQTYDSQHGIVGGIFQLLEGRALEPGARIGVRYGEAFKRNLYRPASIIDVSQLI